MLSLPQRKSIGTKETSNLQTQEDQIIETIIKMDLGSEEELISLSKKSISFSAKSAKSAAKSTVGSEDISSFWIKDIQTPDCRANTRR